MKERRSEGTNCGAVRREDALGPAFSRTPGAFLCGKQAAPQGQLRQEGRRFSPQNDCGKALSRSSRVGSGIEDPAVVWTISQADWVGFIIPSARCTQAPGSERQAVKKKRLKVNTKGIRSSMCVEVFGGGGRDVTFVTNLQDKG